MLTSNCQQLIQDFQALKKFFSCFEVDKNNLKKTQKQKEKIEIGVDACKNDLERIIFSFFKNKKISVTGVDIDVFSGFSRGIKIRVFPMGQKRDFQKIKKAAFAGDFKNIFPGKILLNNSLEFLIKNKYFKITDVEKMLNGTIHMTLEFQKS